MTILLTGGLGKTTSRVAKILTSENHKILIASRSGFGSDYPAVKFDWSDPSSWNAVFESPEVKASPITAVYLVLMVQENDNAYNTAMDFISLARKHGTERFVFLSTSAVGENGPNWRSRLHSTFKKSEFDWTILRPSWFMQNFSETAHQPVKSQNRVISAAADGEISFVDAEDIAAVAAKALTVEPPLNRDVLILGPELLSYDDVASILSNVTGRQITHQRFSEEGYIKHLMDGGLPENEATLLGKLDTAIAGGSEARLSDDVATVLGRPPRSFRDFAEAAKNAF